MKNRILIIGSTGQLGSKLLKYCYKMILIDSIVCFKNKKKLLKQKNEFWINNYFCLNSNGTKIIL